MKIKRINKIKVNSFNFSIKWDSGINGGSISYSERTICIGIKGSDDSRIFDVICHEIFELVAIEMNVRLNRPDCNSDYIFVFDHRQHDTMINMFASVISQFIK